MAFGVVTNSLPSTKIIVRIGFDVKKTWTVGLAPALLISQPKPTAPAIPPITTAAFLFKLINQIYYYAFFFKSFIIEVTSNFHIVLNLTAGVKVSGVKEGRREVRTNVENKNRKTSASNPRNRFCSVMRHLGKSFSILEPAAILETLSAALTFYAPVFYVAAYPLVVVYAVLWLNVGVYSWFIIGGFLAAPTFIWAWIVSRRLANYIRLLMSNYVPVDIDKAVDEYLELVKERK